MAAELPPKTVLFAAGVHCETNMERVGCPENITIFLVMMLLFEIMMLLFENSHQILEITYFQNQFNLLVDAKFEKKT